MLRLALIASLLLSFPFHAIAAESNIVATDHDSVSLVSAVDSFVPGKPLLLGLRLRLAPGWHTYWSNPGDAGEAPSIAITGSGGVRASTIDWPAPLRLPDGPLMSYGYTGDVVLPVSVPATAPGASMLHLTAKAEWLACANVCVPESGSFMLDLPRGRGAASAQAPSVASAQAPSAASAQAPSAASAQAPSIASPQAPLFAAAQARLPVPSPFPAHFSRDGTLSLSGDGLGPEAVRDAWFLPAEPGQIDQIAPQKLVVTQGRVSLSLHLQTPPSPPLVKLDGLVVLRDPAGNQSFLAVSAQPGTAPTAAATADVAALPRLLLFALLGGIVLNLMPCVFPVLAMKALALARLSGAARAELRLSAAFYTAGVLVAFAGLGGLMLGLRAAGSAVGWGFQFQSALFVAGTCWLLFAVGLNLTGLFEIGAGITGVGQGLTARRGHGGDFATGLLAVLVATPCTAPFMAVAIAGALSAPAVVGMAIFLAMGLGLALPYVLLALVPGLAARLPRPGVWMEVLRQALSFPIFASCAWLAWVASIEGGDRAVLVLASGLVLLGMAGWLLGLSQKRALRWPSACVAASAVCAIAALALLPALDGATPAIASGLASSGAEMFSETRLASLRAEGRPVFVDMTAAWCVTCLVNERVALSPSSVQKAFASHHVAYLKGDWTGRDPQITTFLRTHGRDGVPFYLYYPAHGEGRVLPQILTESRVLREIDG